MILSVAKDEIPVIVPFKNVASNDNSNGNYNSNSNNNYNYRSYVFYIFNM